MSSSTPGKSSHRVVVASEEQFKIYSLPLQKSNNNVVKYKLTALEGVRVRRMSFARFSCVVPPSIANNVSKSPSKTDNTAQLNTSVDPSIPLTHTEVGLLCLTNAGDCLVFSIPELKKQINAAAVRREDIRYVCMAFLWSPDSLKNSTMICRNFNFFFSFKWNFLTVFHKLWRSFVHDVII